MKRIIPLSTLPILVMTQSLDATELLPLLQEGNHEAVIDNLLSPSGAFTERDGRRFIQQLIDEIKAQYGIEADLQHAVDYTMRVMVDTGDFSEEEINLARKFYARIVSPENEFSCQKPRLYGKHKNKSPELVLPDHLAVGFCSMLGGGLLLILPFGFTQGIGLTLIGIGIEQIVQGAIEGEKIHYAEPTPHGAGLGVGF